MKSLLSLMIVLAIGLCGADAQQKKKKKRTPKAVDGKNVETGKKEPAKNPALAPFGIYARTAPLPERVPPATTTLPLKLSPGMKICYVGNTLLDREGGFGHFEAMIQQQFPGLNLKVRNLCWSADEVDLQPRPANFASMDQHLTLEKADVIFAAFGFNESFAGVAALPGFKERLGGLLQRLKTSAFNGKTGPQIILLSPAANENVTGVRAADLNNPRLAAYTTAMKEVAAAEAVGFVDVFKGTRAAMAHPDSDLTFNGVHLKKAGNEVLAAALFKGSFGKEAAPRVDEDLRKTVADKNQQYFYRYRPVNTFYYTGGRNKRYGYLDFLPAMRNFELMVANRDQRIWDQAAGKPVPAQVDDSSVPKLPTTAQSRGANTWMTPADERAAFKVDERFDVNLFASEEQFPDIACPIQMRWDNQGRLWVACSTTYPHVYPGHGPRDKIVILEDTDHDGRADTSQVWADDVHIPLSFEFGDGGVYVSEEPHFSFLKDTDGDGKADFRRQVFTGFGTEDSHHALHDFVWTPDGDLLFRESIFHNSQVETVYGPIRAKNSAWFRYRPDTHRLVTFGNYPNTNPWGVTFDDWGNHVASHPIFATAFHATNPPYPTQHPKATGIPAYSGTCGQEFVDFPSWPKELQGGFVKVRYKPTNRVEMHRWVEQDDHFKEEYLGDIIFSTNLSFIPVDLRFGPRGAMYVCDWYNPIKGHAQYSLRDKRRDRTSGRIWRILPKGAKLQEAPAIADQPVSALLDILKRPEYRYRYWAKRELRARKASEVRPVLDRWVAGLDAKDPRFRHHQVEALWTYRSIGAKNPDLLETLLTCDEHHARAAATRQLRYGSGELFNAMELLRARANDTNGIVRMEAIMAATYIGTRESLEAAIGVLKHPMGSHLKYAVTTSLGSESLSRHLDSRFHAAHPEVKAFNASFAKFSKITSGITTRNATESNFDSQKGLAVVEISCVPERLLFTKTRFKVRPGQPVKLVFTNPDVTPHNLLIVQPGALEEIGIAGNMMAKDPSGTKKGFIPKSSKILHHTRLLEQDTGEVLRFNAPRKPGKYPYLCTFPGHWVIMQGVMVVEP
jgi:plastocyanin